jgi:hypothetical protein
MNAQTSRSEPAPLLFPKETLEDNLYYARGTLRGFLDAIAPRHSDNEPMTLKSSDVCVMLDPVLKRIEDAQRHTHRVHSALSTPQDA